MSGHLADLGHADLIDDEPEPYADDLDTAERPAAEAPKWDGIVRYWLRTDDGLHLVERPPTPSHHVLAAERHAAAFARPEPAAAKVAAAPSGQPETQRRQVDVTELRKGSGPRLLADLMLAAGWAVAVVESTGPSGAATSVVGRTPRGHAAGARWIADASGKLKADRCELALAGDRRRPVALDELKATLRTLTAMAPSVKSREVSNPAAAAPDAAQEPPKRRRRAKTSPAPAEAVSEAPGVVPAPREPEPCEIDEPEPVEAPEPHYADGVVTLYNADCLDVLRALPDASVDAVVTDPPYGLSELKAETTAKALAAWLAGDRTHVPDAKGFMGRRWDAFVPPPAVWDECLRVLKPGGHLLAFAGSRTADLMGLSVRLAGFEIRDTITWHYASGFPKSLDVSKAIDKAGGGSPADQGAVLKAARERVGLTRQQVADAIGCKPQSVGDWEDGRARTLGEAREVCVPSEMYRAKLADLLGYTEDERRIVGVDGGSRGLYETGHRGIKYSDARTDAARRWEGWGTALKPASEPIVVARKPLAGTVAANVLAHGTGALNIDECRVGSEERVNQAGGASSLQRVSRVEQGYRDVVTSSVGESSTVTGRWPANVVLSHAEDCGPDGTTPCVEGCPVAELDAQSVGTRAARPSRAYGERSGAKGDGWRMTSSGTEYDDMTGGASRFFPTFRYQAKAPTRERPKVDGVAHPTVKPLALMQWLVRLVTPEGGTVLEPFAGSGTTVEACIAEGFRVVAVEREAEYLPLIAERIRRQAPSAVEQDGAA